MKLITFLQQIGFGTPLTVVADGKPGAKHMESMTMCDYDLTDPEFQQMLKDYGEREVFVASVHDNRLRIVVTYPPEDI